MDSVCQLSYIIQLRVNLCHCIQPSRQSTQFRHVCSSRWLFIKLLLSKICNCIIFHESVVVVVVVFFWGGSYIMTVCLLL